MKNKRGREGHSSSKKRRESDLNNIAISNHGNSSPSGKNLESGGAVSSKKTKKGRKSVSSNGIGEEGENFLKAGKGCRSEEDKNKEIYPNERNLESGGAVSSKNRKKRRKSVPGEGGADLQKAGKGYGSIDPTISQKEVDSDDDSGNGDGALLRSPSSDFLSGVGFRKLSVSNGGDSLTKSAKECIAQPNSKGFSGEAESYLSQTRFEQCSISPLSLKAIKDAGYQRLTVVQEATLPIILKGKDVLAKAKTGTGKTLAFLLPAVEVIIRSHPIDHDRKRTPISVLVICPTRELANQASKEAKTLLKYNPSIGVQVVVGGTNISKEIDLLQKYPCQILIATPGRLNDHIENTDEFASQLMGVKILVLDEADRLLDMGFRKDIEKIIAAVPKDRQTLLFSATVPKEVRQICHTALKTDHEFIDTVEKGSEETHSQVRQAHLIAPLDKHFSLLYLLLNEHISEDVEYKIIVFCITARVVQLVADILSKLNFNVLEIHSRKSQSFRTKVSDEFRKSKRLILVTSDVSARGVDYPDVSLVIQVGLPADREQYIHRLGRTGRKGKEGEGILVLAPWEEFFLYSVKNLPIAKGTLPSVDPGTEKKVEEALSRVEMQNKEAAYQAWLGYYSFNKNVGRDKRRLVELGNEFSRSMGLKTPPAIYKQVIRKMGLSNVPGLRSK